MTIDTDLRPPALSAVIGVTAVRGPEGSRPTIVVQTSKDRIAFTPAAARYLRNRLDALLGRLEI